MSDHYWGHIIEPSVGVMRGLADRVIAMTCRNWSYLILSLGKEGGCYSPRETKLLRLEMMIDKKVNE